MPFFSIIIPVYNVAPYLRECLDSVLAQTFTDWEAICVDDGSTDGSGTILDEYAAKDKRFKVIHQANAGVSAARNTALDVANGEWVGFLDADDVWADAWLSEVAASVSVDVDWIRTGWTDWNVVNGIKTIRQSEIKSKPTDGFTDCVISVGWYIVAKCGFPFVNFYRRSSIGTVRFQHKVRIREDALFCFGMVLNVRKLKIINAAGYFRRERTGSAFFSHRRSNDTLNLLARYAELWKDEMPKLDHKRIHSDVLEASTFWVHKDIKQWFELCRARAFSDAWKVWRSVRELLRLGAISGKLEGTLFDRLRWKIYLATGCGRVLLINRHNPIGRCDHVQSVLDR